jgi:hypothetical protein
VPASLNRYRCWQFHPEQPATCQGEPGGDRTPIVVPSAAGRYNPLYYAVVGWPMAALPDWAGILFARLLSAALCAAMLASAFRNALVWSRGRIATIGVVVATTPMVAQMGGAINPNGLEIASGVALFGAGVPLIDALRRHVRADATEGPSPFPSVAGLLHQVGIAAFTLAVLRAAGPLWLVVSLLALLAPFSWRLLRLLWSWRAVRRWTLAVGLAVVASVAWTEALGTAQFGDYTGGQRYTGPEAVWWLINTWPAYLNQAIGVMSWLDTSLPSPIYTLWQIAAGALVVTALVVTDRAGRWRLAATAAAAFLVPSAAMLAMINTSGAFAQGRYFLPVLVGLPITAAYLIADAPAAARAAAARRAARTAAVVLLPINVLALAYTMVRWQRGLVPIPSPSQLNPFGGVWHPPLGSVVPLLAAVLGTVILGVVLWRCVGPRVDEDADQAQAGVRTSTDPAGT